MIESLRGCAARRLIPLLALLAMLTPGLARAEVVRLEISGREPFADGEVFGRSGPYERIIGRMFLEVDPTAEANARVVDLKLAPRNARGRVEFWTDFFLLKPVDASRGNRRLFYDVNNRGNKRALQAFNDQAGADLVLNDPRTKADAGNGFLMREGYSVLWCGWNGDVAEGGKRLMIGLPVATDGGRTITGRIHAEVVVNKPEFSQPFAWGNTDPYPSVTLDNREATLTMRPNRAAAAVEIPREEWGFARFVDGKPVPDLKQLYVKAGFRPGWLYELVYTARDPRVTGLGFAAVRDVVSFLRHAPAEGAGRPNPLAASIEKAYVFGISQSGRFINHMVYEGFNADEAGRVVFDGAMLHVGGPGRGYFNHRFAQTTRHGSQHEDVLSPSEIFPFTSTPQEDRVTGERGEILARARRQNVVPKMFFTENSSEYWSRAASLLHTDVAGENDVAPDPQVRIYFIAGGQHGVTSNPDRDIYRNPMNILDHRPVLRALLKAMDRWVSTGAEPPASRYPQLADRTLVDLATYQRAFPAVPGVKPPAAHYVPLRLDFGPRFAAEGIADVIPPKAGAPYRTLVPAIDADGNELAGVRLPDVAAPVATFTGWNPRDAAAGAEGALGRYAGSYVPFSVTPADRDRSGDSRRSVRERYPTREAYLAKVAETALALQADRLLLDEDLVAIEKAAAARRLWDGP